MVKSTPFPFAIVGFDLDGTLLDTSLDIGHALNHTLRSIGRPIIPVSEVRRLIGGGTGQTLRMGLLETGGALPDDETEALQDVLFAYYEDHIADHTRLYPGGEAMLDALAARGVTLAVATNKKEHLARAVFDALGLTDRFAVILGGDSLGPGKSKPAPDLLHAMIQQAGGGRAAFVGDTTYDIGAARAAALPVVAVSFGFHDMPPHELGADAVIDHFDALVSVLERLG
ncbi:MAG: HAD-IA family hydrolase [Novosphingobium sp.]|nr:HAD-IA family hydrolase [Novosphingobium sp.]